MSCLCASRLFSSAPFFSANNSHPFFRTGTILVPVDIRVVDREGNPVRDPHREDFTIFEDGNYEALEKEGITFAAVIEATDRAGYVKVVVYDHGADWLGSSLVELK